MGIEALLHSTIHGRHGKNTSKLQDADGESLVGGFAGLLQGHLVSAARPTEATDSKSSLRAIDAESTLLATDTAAPNSATLTAIIPAAVSAVFTEEPRPSTSIAGDAASVSDQPVPATRASVTQSASQEALAAAATALDAITPRNAAPIDRPAESTTRIEQASTTTQALSLTATATPVGEAGRFTEQLARATTRTADPVASARTIPANRQADNGDQAAKTATPAAANTTAPAVISEDTPRTVERTPALGTAAASQRPTSAKQENVEKLPPAQHSAISQAFGDDRERASTPLATAPATPLAAAAGTASPALPSTTSNEASQPASKPTPSIPTATEDQPEVASEIATAPDAVPRLTTPRPLPGARSNASTALTQDVANNAPESTGLAKAAQASPQGTQAPAPNVPLSNEMPAPAVVATATTDTQSGRRPAIRNTTPETRTSVNSPSNAASDGSDEILAVPQAAQPVRSSAASALPVAETKLQGTTMTVTNDAKPSSADGTNVPADSAKLAAMPAVAANTASPAGLAVSGEASATQHPETTLQLPTHLRDPRWGEHLGERVVVLAQGEKNSAQIDINPAQLGPIRVKIDMSGDQVSVQFSSASSEVRQVLEDALPRLREQLANSGIQLGQANVGSQSQQTPREAFAQSTPSPRSPGEGAILPAESALEAQSSGRMIQSGRGLVDLFA